MVFFLKEKRNWTRIGSIWLVSVQFGSAILEQKPVQTSLARFFQLGSVFIKKITKPVFLKKKNRNWFRPSSFSSVHFGYFRTKTGSNWFDSVFSVWLGFSLVWLGFFLFWVWFCSVWFFRFQIYKTEPVGFLKFWIGLIGFFLHFGFFGYFFLFSRFNRFFSVFAHPSSPSPPLLPQNVPKQP